MYIFLVLSPAQLFDLYPYFICKNVVDNSNDLNPNISILFSDQLMKAGIFDDIMLHYIFPFCYSTQFLPKNKKVLDPQLQCIS